VACELLGCLAVVMSAERHLSITFRRFLGDVPCEFVVQLIIMSTALSGALGPYRRDVVNGFCASVVAYLCLRAIP
jgi:hypothetical protein